jgi:predicted transcriptional regulator
MTREQIEAVLARVRTWPIERQEDAARMLMTMEKIGLEPYILSDEERADLKEALAEADRGEFATDEEVEAVFARCRQKSP